MITQWPYEVEGRVKEGCKEFVVQECKEEELHQSSQMRQSLTGRDNVQKT
jgi:hypothetical protein